MNRQASSGNLATYTPESPLRHPRRLLVAMLVDLWRSRELAWCLALQEINARYRQSALGLLWVFIVPLLNMLAWLFIQASGAVVIRTGEIPYPVFAVTGVLSWSVFADAVVAPLQQAQSARQVLAKIRIPPESLILSGTYQMLFTAIVKMAVLLAALLWLGVAPTFLLLLVPVAVLSLVLVGTTIGLAATPVGLLYADVGRAIPLGLQFLMYLSPVVYATPTSAWAAWVIDINPFSTLIEFARAVLVGTPPDDIGLLVAINLGASGLLLLAWMVYRATLPILIERMGS